jgi:hypothetical protein
MTAERAAYFMRRFKKEEKLLGPNEQAAVDYVIELLEQLQAQGEAIPSAYGVTPRYEDCDGYFDFTESKETAETLRQRGWKITPLFAHAQVNETKSQEPSLKWCDHCGEGVTDFCRGKGDDCAYGFHKAGQPQREIAKLSESKSTKEQESSIAITSAFLNRTLAERIKDAETKAKAVRELRVTLGKKLNRGRGR